MIESGITSVANPIHGIADVEQALSAPGRLMMPVSVGDSTYQGVSSGQATTGKPAATEEHRQGLHDPSSANNRVGHTHAAIITAAGGKGSADLLSRDDHDVTMRFAVTYDPSSGSTSRAWSRYEEFDFPFDIPSIRAFEQESTGSWKLELVFDARICITRLAIVFGSPVSLIFAALHAWGFINWEGLLGWYPLKLMTTSQRKLFLQRMGGKTVVCGAWSSHWCVQFSACLGHSGSVVFCKGFTAGC